LTFIEWVGGSNNGRDLCLVIVVSKGIFFISERVIFEKVGLVTFFSLNITKRFIWRSIFLRIEGAIRLQKLVSRCLL